MWVLAHGSAQVHSTPISIYVKLYEGLYGLEFVPVLNFLKYSTISCRHVHKVDSIVQLGSDYSEKAAGPFKGGKNW
mgnify:CR=1 FL=1